MSLKISLDMDGCIVDFYDHYTKKFGKPKTDFEITKNVVGPLRKDKEFWLTQPVIREIECNVNNYCTARVIKKEWIKEQLIINNFPKAPIYQVFGVRLSKLPQLRRSGATVHIDDSLSVFKELNMHGFPCLLIDAPNNQEWGPIGRIYSLNEHEIRDTYKLFMKTVFNNFKNLIV